MIILVSRVPRCHICEKLVTLEFSKLDEQGSTVHEGCYLLKNPTASKSLPRKT
jgi:hypothetical protein